jgi:hypothetical protein
MGAKTWMIVYADGPLQGRMWQSCQLDRQAATALAQRLFPNETLTPLEDGSLAETSPPNNEICIGCFSGLAVVAAKEFGADHPSRLPARFIEGGEGRTVYLHAMHSVVDWFAFAVWEEGRLQRSLSLSPDSGIIEDIGQRLAFELPYWAGDHPAVDPGDDPSDYPFAFHPLEMGEAALGALFGYHLEGLIDDRTVEPETIPLMRFKRGRSLGGMSRSWWKLW